MCDLDEVNFVGDTLVHNKRAALKMLNEELREFTLYLGSSRSG